MGNKEEEVIKLYERALQNSKGAYNALKIAGVDSILTGLKGCEDACNNALKAIEESKNTKVTIESS